MIMSWASHTLLRLGSTAQQGYTACFLADFNDAPAHSHIPYGVDYTPQDDRVVEDWLIHAPETIQTNTIKKYIRKEVISRDQSYKLLKSARLWIFS